MIFQSVWFSLSIMIRKKYQGKTSIHFVMKDKENIDETGLQAYAMPFKQEEDLYRWNILILVP